MAQVRPLPSPGDSHVAWSRETPRVVSGRRERSHLLLALRSFPGRDARRFSLSVADHDGEHSRVLDLHKRAWRGYRPACDARARRARVPAGGYNERLARPGYRVRAARALPRSLCPSPRRCHARLAHAPGRPLHARVIGHQGEALVHSDVPPPEVAAEGTLHSPVAASTSTGDHSFADILLPLEGMGIGFHFKRSRGPSSSARFGRPQTSMRCAPAEPRAGPALRARAIRLVAPSSMAGCP